MEPITSVGRYAFGTEIARGGMGVVYRATDTVLNREVAVKVLQEKFGSHSNAARRFVEEAQITGQLQHPGIPAVHDLGTLPDGRPFLAMKLIEGKTLAELLDAGPRPDLIGVFEHLCQAVAFAHSRGIIHRDLKPANIMVGAFGEVQVMDWGLAKELQDRVAATSGSPNESRAVHPDDPDATTEHLADESTDERTHSGQAMGTPAYMPPEQARGDIEKVDRRSDVFALGGVLCAILTGRPPYTGLDGTEVMDKAERADLDDATTRLDACGADAELVDACQGCLCAEPAGRPADAGEVAKLIAAHRAKVEERLRTAEREWAEAAVRAKEEAKRRRIRRALVGTAASLLVVVVASGWLIERQSSRRKQLEAEQETSALRQQVRDEQQRSIEQQRVARNDESLAFLLDRCETALRVGNAELVELALADIGRRSRERTAAEWTARIERCRIDLAMLKALDRIDQLEWTVVEGGIEEPDRSDVKKGGRFGKPEKAWPAAFREFGIVPGTTSPEEAARRINESLLKERLIATLDRWLHSDRSDGLLAILRAVDADLYRDDVRAAVQAHDRLRLRKLVGEPQALKQPTGFVAALGSNTEISKARRKAILLAVTSIQPDHFSALMELSLLPVDERDDGPELQLERMERVVWNRAALAVRPNNATAWNNLGAYLDELGDAAGAIASFRRATEVDPRYARGFFNLGHVLRSRWKKQNTKEDLLGAAEAYQSATRIEPNYMEAFSNLGGILLDLQDADGAEAACRRAIDLKPDQAIPHEILGRALKMKNDWNGAAAAFRVAIDIDPNYAAAHNNLGTLLAVRGDLDGAIACFEQAVQLVSKHPIYKKNLDRARDLKAERDARIAPPPREVKR